VAGFYRGAKPPASVTGFSQLERRLKPTPHKNVGIGHGSGRPRDMNRLSRRRDHGTGAKSRARQTRAVTAVTQASSSIRRDLLLPNQHRKCLISFDVVLKVISYVSTARSIALFMQNLFSEAPHRINITSKSLNQVSIYLYTASRV